MRRELAEEGHDVYIVAINMVGTAPSQGALTAACSFPLLQDTEEVDAWGLLGGHKDDFFVFDATGAQVDHLPFGGDRVTTLSEAEGWDNVKAALLAAE